MAIDQKKTVLFLPAWYPNRTHLSVGSFVRSHAEAINTKLKVDVLLVFGDESLEKLFDFQQTNVNGINTYIQYFKKPKSTGAIAQFVKASLYVIGQFYGYFLYRKQQPKPAFFHVHVLTRAAILPLVLNFFSKTAYYITEHWSRYLPADNSYQGWLRKLVTKQVVKKASGITAVSENLKLNMLRHGLAHPNFKVISNVTKPIFFNGYRYKESLPIQFVHVSNFAACKNVKGILEAVQLLNSKGCSFSLKMVGSGEEYEAAKIITKQLALTNVTFTGFIYGTAVVEAMINASAIILFSDYENQPVVITEALSLGVPVIATSVGGIPEMINQSNGILIAANDVEALAAAMLAVASGEIKFDSEVIKADALQKFHPSVVANQFLDFYRLGGAEI